MRNLRDPLLVLGFIAVALAVFILSQLPYVPRRAEDKLEDLRAEYSQKFHPGVDHSKLPALQKSFKRPQDVTLTCLSCHTERHEEVMRTSHWNWEREAFIPGRGVTYAGKKNLLNNFCIGIGSNEPACTRCHIGYGWKDSHFDFTKKENIDCLVCHDNSGQYIKGKGLAGYPAPDVDLGASARSVGLPTRTNCGNCHFFGGGGNNVKHGDLEEALFAPSRDVDVHMALDGMDLQCVDCHKTKNHRISGKMYSVSSMNCNRATCAQCHGEAPHDENILNEHTLKVACQTCHIPIYAKVNATKMTWDWSTAGKLKDGKPYAEEDEDGNHIYLSIKGSFTYGKRIKPEYVWFNGTADHYFPGDQVDTSSVIKINTLFGEYDDPDAKIIPVKIHRARQIYDCRNRLIIQPKLFAMTNGEGAFWKDFDWQKAAEKGMNAIGQPYSGHYCFVNTEMFWPLNHMVSPKEESVSCEECHTRKNSRLANLQDFYMPGRNYSASLDLIGTVLIVLSLIGVFAHGIARYVTGRKEKSQAQR